MSNLLSFLKALVPSMQSQRERDEAYLAEALDIYDLERRLREIDARGRPRYQRRRVRLWPVVGGRRWFART